MDDSRQYDLSNIGVRLKVLRTKRKLSMRELSSRSGVTVSHISNIENNETSPTIMTLNKLLDALDVSVPDFFGKSSLNWKQIAKLSHISVPDFFGKSNHSETNDRIVYRQNDRRELKGNERVWSYLFPSDPDIKVIITYEEYIPHTSIREPELHHNDFCGYVLDGELTIDIPEKGRYIVHSGESFYLKAGTEHISYNDSDNILTMIVIELKH